MNLKKWVLMNLALLLAVAVSALQLSAQTQTTGEITGVVTDQSGAAVPNAKITLKDDAKGTTTTTETNKDGVYHFQLLIPSNYTVSATSSGFQEVKRTVNVALGVVTSADIQLTIGSAAVTVTVEAQNEPLLQTENGNVATTFNQQQLSETPNPGNDLTAIVQTAPGVVMNTAGGLGNFSDHGVGAASNLFTLNGMDDNDPFLNLNSSGATNLLLGSNEIQESTIVSTGYSAEFGSLAGANVSYVTKSGSNSFHGNAVYYWNGSALNANDWFLNHAGDPKNFSNANQWAASIGGPIKKDKLFFFFNTEGLRVIIPVSTAVAFPSQAFQTATIANLENNGFPANSATVNFYQNIFNLYNNAKGAAKAVPGAGFLSPDPLGCNGFTGLGPGVACSSFFQAADNNLTTEAQYAGRIDYNLTDNDRLFLRVLYDKGNQASDTDPISPLFNITSTQPQWQGQLNETHTFGSTMVNQFILSGQWYSAVFDNANRTETLAAFPTTINFGGANIPWFNIGGAAAGGAGDAFFPQGRNVTQYQIGDDFSKSLGNHTLKFGTKFLRYDVSDQDFGVFTSGLVTPNSVAAFFNGGVDPAPGGASSVLQQSFPTALSQPIALYTLAFYGEDDWKIKSNLTLTFALRVEHESNPVCQTNCFNRLNAPFLLADNNVNTPYSTDVLQGLHQELQGLSAILWQPRFGFAWSPFGSHRTVVRGGVGLFNDAFPAVFTDNFASNAPGVNTFVVAGSNIAPGETLNGGNLFAQAAASNVGLINGFKNNQTLAQIQANVPNFAPPSLFSANATTKIAQFQKWSLEVQQALGQNTTFDVAYNGNHSIHDLVDRNGVNGFCSPLAPNTACAAVPSFVGLPAQPFDPRFGTVSLLDTSGISNYEGVTFSFKHNISSGWGKGVVQANYTYSHAFDDVSNGGNPNVFFSGTSVTSAINPFNIQQNYGPSDYDVRHYFNASYVWELPIRRALLGRGWAPMVDGWQVSGTIFVRSGLPYSVVDGGLDGLLSAQGFGGVVLPQFLGGPTSRCGSGAATGVTPCLTTAQFVPSTTETNFVGGLRNIFRGPGYWNTDFTVQKKTKIPHWEQGEFGLAFQFFNLFNHPNFNLPNNDLTGALGSISSTVSEPTSILGSGLGGDASVRIIQVKASVTF